MAGSEAPSYRRIAAREVCADPVLPMDDEGEGAAPSAAPAAPTAQRPRRCGPTTSLPTAAGAALLLLAGAAALQHRGAPRPASSASVAAGGTGQLWSWNPLDWFGWNPAAGEETETTVTTAAATTTTTAITTTTSFPDFAFPTTTSTTATSTALFQVLQGSPAELAATAAEPKRKPKAANQTQSRLQGCAGAGGNCATQQCCQQEGLYCFEKRPGLAGCKASCSPGPDLSDADSDPWTCKPLGDHTGERLNLSGPLAPWVEQLCAGNGSLDDCHLSMCCRDPGMQCYQKVGRIARCRASCAKGVDPADSDGMPWTCAVLGPRTPGPVPNLTADRSDWVDSACSEAEENCHKTGCCKGAGLRCYLQDAESGKAGCRASCEPGRHMTEESPLPWNCTALGGRTPGDAPEEEPKGQKAAAWVKKVCAKGGENCTAAGCCAEPGQRCYVKDAELDTGRVLWAACRAECRAGPNIFDVDSNSWSCAPLGPVSPGKPQVFKQEVADWVEDKCSGEGESCEKTRCCKGPGMQCYMKAEGWAMCRATCDAGSNYFDVNPDPWSCKKLGPRTPGKPKEILQKAAAWVDKKCSATGGEDLPAELPGAGSPRPGNCLRTACCKDDGMQCYAKNVTYGHCMQSCSPTRGIANEDGVEELWACDEVGVRHPGRAPCVEDGDDCRHSRCCKTKGNMCFEKDEFWGECSATCDADAKEGWSCKPLGDRRYGRELGCSWAGADCGLTKVCCEAGMTCYSKDEHFASCAKEPGEGWVGTWLGGPRTVSGIPSINGSEGSNSIQPVPGESAGTRLYCFIVVMQGSLEEDLLQVMKDLDAGIFQCEENDILYGRKAAMESWGSVQNSGVFVDIWREVVAKNQFQLADWTVKVDPDAVFFPDRLQALIVELAPPPGEPIYLKNSFRFNGFLGAVEVFSTAAVELYSEFGREGCHNMAQGSGEDGYFKDCMDAIGAKFMLHNDILRSNTIPELCDSRPAVFHPIKNPDVWKACWEHSMHPPATTTSKEPRAPEEEDMVLRVLSRAPPARPKPKAERAAPAPALEPSLVDLASPEGSGPDDLDAWELARQATPTRETS